MNSIKKVEKNKEISEEIRKYFNEKGLNIDEIFSTSFNSDNKDLSDINSLIMKINSDNRQVKILLFTQLLEMRSQIKDIQQFLAEMSKNLERSFKELNDLSKKD